MSMWAVFITDETGISEGWLFRSYERASAAQEQLSDWSGRYGGEGPEVEVNIVPLSSWPGIMKVKEVDGGDLR